MQVKEQYLSRGDMWRFTRKLASRLVFVCSASTYFPCLDRHDGLSEEDTRYLRHAVR